jgi:putative FmdB family regulatory protein
MPNQTIKCSACGHEFTVYSRLMLDDGVECPKCTSTETLWMRSKPIPDEWENLTRGKGKTA